MRAVTMDERRMRRENAVTAANEGDLDFEVERPKTRGDCLPGGCNEERPCPFVSCRHHLYLDVDPRSGSVKFNHPHKEVWELEQTCALDVADGGARTLEEAGLLMNLTRERQRQLEAIALRKVKREASKVDARED